MHILIDADACPNKEEIINLATAHAIPVVVFMDYAHEANLQGCEIVHCEVGNDSVDMAIIKRTQPNDIVITQDYGLASLVLGKGAQVLHVSGKYITKDNIDTLLLTRYLSAKQRKAGKRTKGPAKRTKQDVTYFLEQFTKLITK